MLNPQSNGSPRPNRADEITHALRLAIVSGDILPGTPLAEPVLAARFGASRAPVREALIALERDGLVEFNERSRTRVRPLTAKDFQEICSMRVALESLAARLLAERWLETETSGIEENIERQEAANTLSELSHLDVEMHELIVVLSGHSRLIAAWAGIRWQFEMSLAYAHRLQEKLAFEPREITVKAHRHLLAALASGKPEEADETMATHIHGSLKWMLAKFPVEALEAPRKTGSFSKLRSAAKASVALVTSILTFTAAAQAASITPEGAAFFESKIRPLLIEHCYDCHSGSKTKGGLALDTKAGWLQGGDTGAAIVPGKPEESLLIQAVRHENNELAMPPKNKGGRLTDAQIGLLEEWVRQGAPDPRENDDKIGGMSAAEAKAWWAFQPLSVSGAAPLTAERIDAMIHARLAQAKLPAAPLADKRTLLRRAAFDLTGLPPTAEETEAFLADESPDAFARQTERLLASPHYGEKWGRHWLDTVRYADSLDSRIYDKDGDILDAWRYRDWVVSSFNRDLPYDQFIMQQVAGDILAAQAWDEQKVVATGLYAIGSWGNGDADKEKVHTDIVDDQIDVTGRAFLGLTLACARCHDHKFDPITARDYYSMAGIFFSSRILERFAVKTAGEKLMRIPLTAPDQLAAREAMWQRIAAIDAQLAGKLEPFTEVKRDVAGKPGLVSWTGRGASNPSLVINTADSPVAFSTIKLPARSIALHPGPKVSASGVWRSPISGKVKVSARLEDADPNCGDGITWLLRHGEETLLSGEINNATSAEVEAFVKVQKGDLLQLSIRPRTEYTCDTTQLEFTIEDEQGHRWDLREALTTGREPGQDNLWYVCAGEGPFLDQDTPQTRRLAAERKQLEKKLADTRHAQGLQEGGIPQTRYEGIHDVEIHMRGRYDMLGEVAPRGWPAVLTREPAKIREGSGRLELARWIASPDNPLTARVMVNRIWQHHFGEGLVRTANNFGKLGTPPSHPELLDALALEFMRSGWSVKHLHRLIMSTTAYQRSSAASESARQLDPDNLLLSHQSRRRLTAEELRDAMLQAAGRLDGSLGGKSDPDMLKSRRTLYLTTIRSDRTSYQMLFDGADPTAIVERRNEATVAPQSLFLMNHPFVLTQAEALANAVFEAGVMREKRVRWLWQRLLQRAPSPEEKVLTDRVLGNESDKAQWAAFCQMMLCSNEFAYVD